MLSCSLPLVCALGVRYEIGHHDVLGTYCLLGSIGSGGGLCWFVVGLFN